MSTDKNKKVNIPGEYGKVESNPYKIKKNIEKNIDWEEKMVKGNKSYDNKKIGMSFGKNHYTRALEYDKKDLKRIKKEIKNNEKIDYLRKKASDYNVSSKESRLKKQRKAEEYG